MGFFDWFRRKMKQSDYKRRDKKQSFNVEPLEDRVLLSHVVDPALFVITHGYQFPDNKPSDLPAWVGEMQKEIARTPNIPVSDSESFVTVNWNDSSNNRGPDARENVVEEIFGEIKDKLPDQGKADIFFIGHSRGAIVNTQVIRKLIGNGRVDRIWMVTLDATAAKPMANDRDNPETIPSNVTHSINYDDGHKLLGIPGELLGSESRRLFTADGFDFQRSPGSLTAITPREVRTDVDTFISENRTFWENFWRKFPIANVGVWIGEKGLGQHAVESHLAIQEWYRREGELQSDVEDFLAHKDSHLPIAEDRQEVDVKPGGPVFPTPPSAGTRDDHSNQRNFATNLSLGAECRQSCATRVR